MKVNVLMPWAHKLKEPKEKVVNLNTWFSCDNCNEKFFNTEGKFDLDGDIYCEDCLTDYLEYVDNSFEYKSVGYRI